ncbi:MAG: hypothetical protein JOZ59_04490, partial [Candidatus Eremiobacteraeota bacterium]|nr:hypothetical protein [Candidatus Eremiobacteraeota bacterium]
PASRNPTAEVLDGHGRVVRTFRSHTEDGKEVPDLTNQAGFNRFSWDLTEDKPVAWDSTGDWNQFTSGATVVPGRYSIVLHADGRTLRAPIIVHRDPRDDATLLDHVARYRLEHQLYADWSRIDTALNTLSTVQRESEARKVVLQKAGATDSALIAQLDASKSRAAALQSTLTSNPKSDQDDDFLKDVLRERVQAHLFLFDTFKRPTAEEEREGRALHALTNERVHAVSAFVSGLDAVNAQLARLNLPSLVHATTAPEKPHTSADAGGETERRGH